MALRQWPGARRVISGTEFLACNCVWNLGSARAPLGRAGSNSAPARVAIVVTTIANATFWEVNRHAQRTCPMCYSAQIWADYRRYVREFGALLDIKEFYDLFWRRKSDSKVKIPRAMETAFAEPASDMEREIQSFIGEFTAEQELKLQQELFKQKKRLADAERSLETKTTKKAEEDRRIATSKISAAVAKLSDLHRTEFVDEDARIFPQHYAPVMVMEDGKRVVRPMRFHCRPEGKPAFYDVKYAGLYNARRDSLDKFWRDLWGYRHGIIVANAFYENVNKHRAEGRELREGEAVENVVLEFKPRPTQDMLLACLWSDWKGLGKEPDLLSFALITDEPPEEVAAAGHDRCVIPIKPEHVGAWLSPNPNNLDAMRAILDDRARPFYEHRWLMAA
jgi:putative SOS response-associated peptidase YedK